MPDTGGPTTIQIQNQRLFERTLKVTVVRLEIAEELVVWLEKNDPAIELQLQKFAYDASGAAIPPPPPARAPPKKQGQDKEVLDVEAGTIARTPTKTHMGLITDFNWTVRMSKTIFDDEGIPGDSRIGRDYNIFGGAIEIDVHRLIAAGELGASELTREFPLLSKPDIRNGHELPRRKIGSITLKMRLDELAPWPKDQSDRAQLANSNMSYPDRNIGTVGIRFVPNAQGFHVITDIKPDGPVWRTGRALIGDILYKIELVPDNRGAFENAIDCKGLSVHQVIEILTGPPHTPERPSVVKLALLDGKFPYLPPKVLEVQREAVLTVSNPKPEETQRTDSKQWYL